MTREYTRTPEANVNRRQSLSATLNDPDAVVSDAKRAVAERSRRAWHKKRQAEILQKVKGK